MTRLPHSLDDLIEQIQVLHPDPASAPLERVADAAEAAAALGQLGEHLVSFFVDEAHRAGEPWAAIGKRLGISRQAVQKRYSAQPGLSDPKRPRVFDRLANDGKRVVKQSEEEARTRRSRYRGTEHFLLGIVAEPESVGARSLALCGAPPPVIVAAVNGRIGVPGGEPGTDKIPTTLSGNAILEHALRESARLGHDYVGTGHLALGCLTVTDGIAAEILNNLGVTYSILRQAVVEIAPTDPPKMSDGRVSWERLGS